MRFKRTTSAMYGLAVLLLSSVSCSMKPQMLPSPDSSQERKAAFISSLTGMYPKNYSAVQRLVLLVRNRHFDFLGHLAVRRDEHFRATAFGEMGGSVFDLRVEEGRAELLKNPLGLPVKPIVNGVADDIRHIFDIDLGSESYLARNEGNALFLVNITGSGLYSEYYFQGQGEHMNFSRTVAAGQLVREVKYEAYADFVGFARPLPRKIFLKNHRWKYELEIELLSISPTIKNFEEF